MGVVIEEFDIQSGSWSTLGRVENGEIVADTADFLADILTVDELSDEAQLLNRFNGPRLVAYPITGTLGKEWIPYEGPRGGEGWQNTEDKDDIRYNLDNPPGEVADGYEDMAEDWGEDSREEFLSDIRSEFGLPQGTVADVATSNSQLYTEWDVGSMKIALKASVYEVTDDDEGSEIYENIADQFYENIDATTEAREATTALFEAVEQVETPMFLMNDLGDRLEMFRWDDDNVPEPPLETRDKRDWYEQIPEADESFNQNSLNEQDAILFEDDEIGLVPGRIFRHEGQTDDGRSLYTLEDGSTIHRDEMVAFCPNETKALRFNGYQRANEGHYLLFNSPVTGEPIGGEVTNIHVEEGNEITAKLLTEDGSHIVHATENGNLRFNDSDDRVIVRAREKDSPEDFDGVLTGMEEDAKHIASEIDDSVSWGMNVEDEVEAELRQRFSKAAVDKFYNAVSDWKSDSGSGLSGQHAQAFKQALDIDSEVRGWDKASEQHVKIAEVMYEVTQKSFATNMTAYRGMSNTGFGKLIDTWLDNPDSEELELSQLAINNYTKSHDTARKFSEGTAVIETRLEPSQIGFAMDYLAARELDNENEMHVIGDDMSVDTTNVTIEGAPLGDFPDKLSTREHEDIANAIEDLYARRMPVNKETHETLFERWADVVETEHGSLLQGENENERVRGLIEEIKTNKKVVYDIERGPQTQLGEFSDEKQAPVVELTDPASVKWNQESDEQPEGLTEARMEALRNWRNRIAEKANTPIGKNWVPYEGPRGGEGWQNTNDLNNVVYQQEPPGEVAEGHQADHWEEYPSDGEWPESPHGTAWKKPDGFGRDAGMEVTDAVAYINEEDEVIADEIAEFNEERNTYTLKNGSVISHSQVVGWSQPEANERVETSVGIVTQGDWIAYDNEFSEGNVAQVASIEINDDKDILSVVGEYGYKQIEIRGRQQNRQEPNANIRQVYTDAPDLFDNVEQNGMDMETEEIVSGISESVDLTDTINATGNTQLTQSQRRNIQESLKKYFPDQYVSTYYGSVSSWKINPTERSSQVHESAFKEALNIESPIHSEVSDNNRGGNPNPSPTHIKIAETMEELSNEFWEQNHGGRSEVYRGISNTAFTNLFPQWLETPNATKYNLKQLAVNNYSQSRDTANEFGKNTAVVTIEASKDDVILCTDAISNIGTVEDESEVQIHGDSQSVDARNITMFGDKGPTLGEHPKDWFREEHTEFGNFMSGWYLNRTSAAENEEPPIPKKQYKTLLEWTDAVTDEFSSLHENPILFRLVREIEHDAEAYFGLDTLGKQYNDAFADSGTKQGDYPVIDLTDDSSVKWLSETSQKQERERLSESLFEELVDANQRRRESVNGDTDNKLDEPNMQLKGRVEISNLRSSKPSGYKESTVSKVGNNFEQTDDIILDAWEKQVCADSLAKAPNMWQRGESVPQFVRTFVQQAATKRDALWDEYNDVPHMAGLKVHEIIKDNVTDINGWSIETIANDLTDEFEGISDNQAETIARTEVAAVLNDARAKAYEASDVELDFYWSGPDDEHTTDLCTEIKQEIENRGGYVSMDTLRKILRRKARKYRSDGGLPERVSSLLPHYSCRHTAVRSEFKFA